MIDCIFLRLLIYFLLMLIFIEDRSVVYVSVFNTKDTVSPTTLEDPVTLAIELLLSLKHIELLQFRLYLQ
jgi:hypothetical protein